MEDLKSMRKEPYQPTLDVVFATYKYRSEEHARLPGMKPITNQPNPAPLWSIPSIIFRDIPDIIALVLDQQEKNASCRR